MDTIKSNGTDRRALQREGKHPAPCARHCEATAFQVELRRLQALLREALPYVESHAEASHLTDGFRRQPDNAHDGLANRIRAAMHQSIPDSEPSVLRRSAVEGVVVYQRSSAGEQVCICCPAGTGHVFSRRVDFEPFESAYPEHFGRGAQEFIGTIALQDRALEGKRVRLTVEVLDDKS